MKFPYKYVLSSSSLFIFFFSKKNQATRHCLAMSLHAKFSQLLRWKFVNDRPQNDLVVSSKSIIICHLNEKKKKLFVVPVAVLYEN